MMRALFSGVTGLSSHQTRMDVIGNNISNVNTVGFKKSAVTFNDIYSQTITASSAPSGNLGGTNAKQVGLGASVNAIVMQHTPGAAQYTGALLDLAIEGDGYFVVNTPDGERYSRDGKFNLSSIGALVNTAGQYVQCYNSVYQKGSTAYGRVTGLENKQTSDFTGFTYTDDGVINAQAQSGVYTFDVITDENDANYGKIEIFRNELETGTFVEVSAAVALTDPNNNNAPITDADGNPLYEYTLEPLDVNGVSIGKITFTSTDNRFNFDANDTVAAGSLSTVEQIADIINYAKIEVTNDDGFVLGQNMGDLVVDQSLYYNVSVDEQGAVVGQLKEDFAGDGTTPPMAAGEKVTLGYVVIATFTNTAGLEKLGGNLYASSPNSGMASYSQAGAQGVGSIAPSSLEMSNVDLSEEMVNMIITQRGFQANSRIITTTDTMLEELINLKR